MTKSFRVWSTRTGKRPFGLSLMNQGSYFTIIEVRFCERGSLRLSRRAFWTMVEITILNTLRGRCQKYVFWGGLFVALIVNGWINSPQFFKEDRHLKAIGRAPRIEGERFGGGGGHLSLEGQGLSSKQVGLMGLSLQCIISSAMTWVSSTALNKPQNTSVSQMIRTVQRRRNYVVGISSSLTKPLVGLSCALCMGISPK